MNRIGSFAASFFLAALFAIPAFAQPAAPAADGKIGLVNLGAFADEKTGITKFNRAFADLDVALKPLNDEMNTLRTRYQTLATEIQNAQKAQNTQVPVANVNAKIEQAQSLEVEIKRKQEDGKIRYEREYQRIVGPVFADIIKAMNEYAKQKGYAVILDGAKLEQAEILLGFNDKYDITKDFIAYYNARPAGSATASKPNP
jgi:Skp family chaperone for outer membrane proteins